MTRIMFFLFVTAARIDYSFERSGGAPASTCTSLSPSHGGLPSQEFPSPYAIVPSKNVIVRGDKIQVVIKSLEPEIAFRGFLMQARSTVGTIEPVGQFQKGTELMNFMDCTTLRDSVSHSTNTEFFFF